METALKYAIVFLELTSKKVFIRLASRKTLATFVSAIEEAYKFYGNVPWISLASDKESALTSRKLRNHFEGRILEFFVNYKEKHKSYAAERLGRTLKVKDGHGMEGESTISFLRQFTEMASCCADKSHQRKTGSTSGM